MNYPEEMCAPMREDLTSVGFVELRTPESVEELLDRKFDYVVQDGKLLIGESGTKKLEISLNDPNFKSRFAKYAKLPPGIGQQQLTEEQINARASQLLSNAGL